MTPVEQIQKMGTTMKEILGLHGSAIGVPLLNPGEPVSCVDPASTAVLQATCVDSTIIPFLERRLNYGLGCYGCRDATDIGPNETVVGFPAEFLPAIVEHLEYLNKRALPHSREKHAFLALKKAIVDEHSCGST